MPAIKLAIVGGGSAYTHHMLRTVFQYASSGDFAGSEVRLMDVKPELARLMGEFGTAVARAKGVPVKVSATGSLDKALDGADFILNTFRTGGLQSRYMDETIPLKYGILGQETTGIGGVFFALRGVPEIVKIVRSAERNCPKATIINYTNPTNFVCDAIRRISKMRSIGLCDGVYGVKWLVARLLEEPIQNARDVEAYVGGLNHCTWSLDIWYKGRRIYDELPELIARAERTGLWKKIPATEWDACRLYRYFHLLPGSLYYTRYYYTLGKVLRQFSDPKFQHRSQFLMKQAERIRAHARAQIGRADAEFLPYDEEHASHGDQAIGTIKSIACDERRMEVCNVQNNGAVPNLPEHAIVEVSCILGRHGAAPIAVGPLPKHVAGVVQAVEQHSELAVEAALEGDRDKVMQAAMAHPCNRDWETMEKVIEELFAAHRAWLPQFKAPRGAARRGRGRGRR